MYRQASCAPVQRCFKGFGHSTWVSPCKPQTILNHVEHQRSVTIGCFTRMHAGIALCKQMALDFLFAEIARHRDRKADDQSWITGGMCAFGHRLTDAGYGIASHRHAAASAMQSTRARKQQLQVIVQLGHRADRGARGAHRIGLVDRNRWWHAIDPVDLRFVHPVEELPRVR